MKKKLFMTALCVILVTGCSVSFNKDSKESENRVNDSNTQQKTSNNVGTGDNIDNTQNVVNSVSTIIFDSSKVINSESKEYTLACQGNASIFVTVDSTQKKLTFNFTPATVVSYYSLNWTSDKNTGNSSVIEFDRKIVDVFFGGMGQSNQGDTLFILLEDGTVEYIPIVHMFNHAQGAPISYGKIEGVTGVVKFAIANVPGAVTTIAIKGDGSFYDLGKILIATGNY